MRAPLLSLFALLGLVVAGCTLDTEGATDDEGSDVSTEEALRTRVNPGTFKLYAEPRHEPNPSCDLFTQLVLTASPARATLTEQLSGNCKIAVRTDNRYYNLREVPTGCGSKQYKGSFRKQGRLRAVTITDHRTRTCKDLVPAKIVLEETASGFPGPITTTKYSYDGQPASPAITASGTLVSVMGIGGESTGAAIKSDQGFFELVLDAGEQNQFVDGKTARVKGTRTTLSGVETKDRPAIIVDEMLVCPDPGTLNCMPRPNVRLSSLCAPENRSWVVASCPGVTYAF